MCEVFLVRPCKVVKKIGQYSRVELSRGDLVIYFIIFILLLVIFHRRGVVNQCVEDESYKK